MTRHLGLLMTVVALFTFTACSDDDSQPQNDASVQTDAQTQSDAQTQNDATVQPDAATTVGCTGDSPTEPAGLGGCCNSNVDCRSGRCIGGWCWQTCSDDSDCGPVDEGPWPTGSPTRCNQTTLSYSNYCIPGSLQQCGAAGDAACPAGEVCMAAWNADATSAADAFEGVCVTAMTQAGVLAPGESTIGSPNPLFYACQTPTFQYTGYYGGRCSMACDPANPTDACPTGMQCSELWASPGNGEVLSGIGICVGEVCGRLEFTGDDDNDVRIPGSNDDCPTGEVCEPWGVNGVDGDTVTHHCGLPDNTLGQIGDDCEHSLKFDLTCANSVYCIQAAAEYDPAGAGCSSDTSCGANEVCASKNMLPKKCSPKPDPGFCSEPCRTDADCPVVDGDPALCASGGWQIPNGEDAYLTYCLAWRFISDDAPIVCDTNADCDTDTGEGCIIVSAFNDTQHCLPHVTQDATGTDCATNGVADCQAGEACVPDEDGLNPLCTTVQAFGDPCDPEDTHRCVGGSCTDIDWEADDGGAVTNTFCGGWCLINADCGANQVCDWDLMQENDPTTTADDVGSGHCRTMVVRTGAGCTVPGDCSNGDGCDASTGRCYTSSAAWGDACTAHSDCPMLGLCDDSVTGGLCYRPGCDPSAGNTGCDNTGACSDYYPVGKCLEDCTNTTDCSRNADGFTCVNGACLAP